MFRHLWKALLDLLARIGLYRHHPNMTCRLCRQSKPLKSSHVVPEFMYQDMYDNKHRFFGLSSNSEAKELLKQKGLREPLLCADCEQQIGRYEWYASGVFYGGVPQERQRTGNLVQLSQLEYRPLKLFFLSLLWRMGITSIPELKGVELDKHEEVLRAMLQREDPGSALDYPCMITAVMIEGKHVPDLIMHGGEASMDQQRVWSFVAAGFVFSFFERGKAVPIDVQSGFLSSNGAAILVVKDITEIHFLHEQLREIAEAKRQRDTNRQN